jgi:ferredoxin
LSSRFRVVGEVPAVVAATRSPLDAALRAWAQESAPPGRALEVRGRGRVLVMGAAADALPAGHALAAGTAVTVLAVDGTAAASGESGEVPFSVVTDRPAGLRGHFGAWTVPLRGGEVLEADAILDLTRDPPAVQAPELRQGYERCDPRNRRALAAALEAVADCGGAFEHPLYVDVRSEYCAHARSQIQGCTRCLDLCPPGALAPAGDHVALDPLVCAGCGLCTAACPTGTLRYDLPAEEASLRRLRAALRAWHGAAGQAPFVLLHGDGFGAELLEATGQLEGGVPSGWLPIPMGVVSQTGADMLAMALAWGAAYVVCVSNPARPDTHRPIDDQIAIVNAITEPLGFGARAAQAVTADPDALRAMLQAVEGAADWPAAEFLPLGERRAGALQAVRHLHAHAPNAPDTIVLPQGAPFGAVEVDPDACTLCLACVGACPTGALQADPDTPRLSFQEEACVQCGLCRATCPERAITLHPRLQPALGPGARRTLHEEPPFACVSCGKPFGVRQSIERTLDRLAGHPMLAADPRLARRVKMCADCRVIDQFRDASAAGERARPRVRTTDDYRPGPGTAEDGKPPDGGRK